MYITKDHTCSDCAVVIAAPVVIDLGRWGWACADCVAVYKSPERQHVGFADWLRQQRGRPDAVGRFARFCDASRIKADDSLARLLLLLVDLEAGHPVQNDAVSSHEAWRLSPYVEEEP